MSTVTAAPITKQANALDSIDKLLASLDAGTKTAEESHTEAGGYQGATEHPVKKEEDRTEDAYEGSRSRENKEDVKEDQGVNAVDGDDVNKEGGTKAALGLGESVNQDDVQLNIGTKQRATGEDSASETDKAKSGKDDPAGQGTQYGKSTHPARTDNDQVDGHKWSGAIAELQQHIKTAQECGNDCVAAITVEADDVVKTKVASMQKEAKPQTADDPEKQSMHCEGCGHDPCDCPDKESVAKKAGADLASAVIGDGQVDPVDKQAESAQVVEDIYATLKVAYQAADLTKEFLDGVRAGAAEKSAMPMPGEEGLPGTNPPGEEEEEGAPPPEYGGGMGGEEEGEGGGDEEALLDALTGGGEGGMPGPEGGVPGMEGGMPGMEGGMPSPEGGGMPGMEGGMPGMGGGMPGAEGPGMGGGIGDEQLLMLAAALQQAGITPEQLEMATAGKAASALKQAVAKGQPVPTNWIPKTAEEGARYQKVVNYVREITSAVS